MRRISDLARLLLQRLGAAQGASLEQQVEYLSSMLTIQTALHAQSEVLGVVDTILTHAANLQPCDVVAVGLRGRREEALDLFVSESTGTRRSGLMLVNEDEAFLAERLPSDPRAVSLDPRNGVPPFLRSLVDDGLRAALVLPMIARNERCGILTLGWREQPGPMDQRLSFLSALSDAGAIAIANAKTAEQREILANYDTLTGLPNRRIFFDRLSRIVEAAERAGHMAAVCFVDLDNFKRVNDTMGHSAGDRALRQIARRLSSCLRQGDSLCRAPLVDDSSDADVLPEGDSGDEPVSRLGGDEFAVLLGKIGEAHDAGIVARRVAASLESPIVVDGRDVFLSSSIGIAVYPLDGESAEDLLRNADTAMYCAKKRGRNGFQYYTKSMNAEASRRLHIESRLRSALARDEFEVWYQQKRETRTGRLVGAEALVRWDDPEMGLVSPAEFIPLAEETGCIGPIGEWVLRSVCGQLRDWQDRGLDPVRVAINLSANQLHQEGLPALVAAILEETGVSPGQLELEVTESAVIEDDEATLRTLSALEEMGIGLALDDFGTGYSSLSHVRRLPLDRIKIDRAFVRELPDNLEDRSLTTAIVAMAKGLNLEVVAEGVETEEQAQFLSEIGCDELQGFLFGRPLRAESFEELLPRQKPEDDE